MVYGFPHLHVRMCNCNMCTCECNIVAVQCVLCIVTLNVCPSVGRVEEEMRLARVPGYANVVFTFQLSCSEFIWIFGGAAFSHSYIIEV